MTKLTVQNTKKWFTNKDNILLMTEWAARLIGWKIGVGGVLAMPVQVYRNYKNDENRGGILIKNIPVLMRIWISLGDCCHYPL
jgi:hypothetical protein